MENSNLIQERQNDHRNTYAIRLILGAASLCVFFLIHYLITAEITLDFDLSAGEAVRALRTPALNAILIPITHMANWRMLVGIGVILIVIDVAKWHKPDYPLAVLACLLTLLIYKILKVVVQRPRPDQIFWLVTESGYSFPSGHSLNGMFCYGMMIYLLWRNCEDKTLRNIVTTALCVLIPLIAFSRVYCGVHHPTDVIAGLAAGFALLMVNTVLLDEILLEMSKTKKHA